MTARKSGEGGKNHPPLAIELEGVSKSFGRVQANRDVSLAIEPGTIHGIIGENGAGKSTLMNTLYGLHRADSGKMRINGEIAAIRSSADAIGLGIGMVHQHFMLVPNFTVLENVMLGTEGGMVLREGELATRKTLQNLADSYGMIVDPDARVEDLPVGIRQRVEIIKAVKGGARILILDEPTGVLTPGEATQLFEILRTLKEDGVTILLITHKLEEIMAVTDAVSIMRDGVMVGHRKTSETSPEELARLMVGRDVLLRVEKKSAKPGETVLQVSGLGLTKGESQPILQEIGFELQAGEILGIAGVSGNGQTELLEILTGMRTPTEGSFSVLGKEYSASRPATPDGMRANGVCHVPEDRHHHGLVLNFEARENTVLGYQRTPIAGETLLLDHAMLGKHCSDLMREHDVRPPNPQLRARNFSGGNQQKLVIAREMHPSPRVLIVGQPTRGVDIGAIEFIHRQLIAMRDEGCAILLVSVELEEIMGLADRIMVMNAGRQVGIISRKQATEETLGLMMAGIAPGKAA